jgi:hypothetical protein
LWWDPLPLLSWQKRTIGHGTIIGGRYLGKVRVSAEDLDFWLSTHGALAKTDASSTHAENAARKVGKATDISKRRLSPAVKRFSTSRSKRRQPQKGAPKRSSPSQDAVRRTMKKLYGPNDAEWLGPSKLVLTAINKELEAIGSRRVSIDTLRRALNRK